MFLKYLRMIIQPLLLPMNFIWLIVCIVYRWGIKNLTVISLNHSSDFQSLADKEICLFHRISTDNTSVLKIKNKHAALCIDSKSIQIHFI